MPLVVMNLLLMPGLCLLPAQRPVAQPAGIES